MDRLRNGHSIHTVSALLLHLVQTCPADLAYQVHGRLSTNKGDTLMKDSNSDVEGDLEEDTSSSLVRPIPFSLIAHFHG